MNHLQLELVPDNSIALPVDSDFVRKMAFLRLGNSLLMFYN